MVSDVGVVESEEMECWRFNRCCRFENGILFSCASPAHLHHSITHLFLQALPRNIRNRASKFDKNVTKRGNVPIGKAAEHEDEYPVSKTLIAFLLFVMVGSSLVQIFNMFKSDPVRLNPDE